MTFDRPQPARAVDPGAWVAAAKRRLTKNQDEADHQITVSVSSTAQADGGPLPGAQAAQGSTMLGSWRPTSVKSTALRTKRVMSQTAGALQCVCAVVSSGVYQPM